jgi:23S rRNA (guanosine2251-2'-O)-methyltransferase
MPRHSFRQGRREPASSNDLIFGLNPVVEALRAAPETLEKLYVAHGVQAGDRVVAQARERGVAVEITERDVLDQMTGGGHHQGVAARTKPFGLAAIEDVLAAGPALLVALDGITDPQNLGAIVRSAEVLGAGGVVLPKDRSVGVTPAVVRASSGAAVHLPVAQVVNLVRALELIKEAGYWIVGLDATGSSKFQELPRFDRVAIVIGGEGKGMRPLVARACDFTVAIPVRGRVSSLNAAAAAAIALHEIASRLPPTTAKPGVR